jgi:hypothetical protein
MLRISKTALANADEVEPDPDEQEIMLAYKSGAPEYQPTISQEDLIKELGL